ncbi:hypothetical protein L9F63_010492, partial [Diploptera punctata]
MATSMTLRRVARFGNVFVKNGTLFVRPHIFKPPIIKHQLKGNGFPVRLLSTATAESPQTKSESDYHSIIKNTEKGT